MFLQGLDAHNNEGQKKRPPTTNWKKRPTSCSTFKEDDHENNAYKYSKEIPQESYLRINKTDNSHNAPLSTRLNS